MGLGWIGMTVGFGGALCLMILRWGVALYLKMMSRSWQTVARLEGAGMRLGWGDRGLGWGGLVVWLGGALCLMIMCRLWRGIRR